MQAPPETKLVQALRIPRREEGAAWTYKSLFLFPVSDWTRAYDEINQFEEQLTQGGAIVVKFWLQISKAEQLRRFRAREHTPFKRFKITADDWRNRKKWNDYEHAVCDMVDRTSTEIAPWTLVEAEDKYFARIKVLRTIVKALETALK